MVSYEEFHPFVYWWIAFYKDGTCLPRFDVNTGKENELKDIDQTKLDRFGLFPFSASMATLVNVAAGKVIVKEVENLPYFIMRVQEGHRLIYTRRSAIHIFTYQHCDKCGYEWQWMMGHKEEEKTEVGFLIHSNHVMQYWEGKAIPCGQCPKCASFNAIVCPECKDVLINELKRSDSDEHYFKCPKCNKEYPRYIRLLENSLRQAIYLLGHQTTIGGKNVKQIMFINEDGIIDLSSNFDYK